MNSAPWIEKAQNRLASRRHRIRAERALRRELATYNTPSEIYDLLAAADRHPSRDTETVRWILHEQLSRTSPPVGVWPARVN